MTNDYQFAVEIRQRDGRLVAERPLEPDWEPACECAWFAAERSTGLIGGGSPEAFIQPIAHPQMGLPYIAGFRVALNGRPECEASVFSVQYFRPQYRGILGDLVSAGLLAAGEVARIAVLANASPPETMPPPAPVFGVIDTPPAHVPRPASFEALSAKASPFGEQTAGDFFAFLPQKVLEEIAEHTLRAGAVETGGVLIGHLSFDATRRDTGIVISAQIPARKARGHAKKLTFTPEAWTAIRTAILRRQSEEVLLGWWHSHPSKWWCAPCPSERRRGCSLMGSFFSEDDVALHRNVFPKAYMVALVCTQSDDGLSHALFGWRDGAVRPRGFHLQPGDRPLQVVPSVPYLETLAHETSCHT